MTSTATPTTAQLQHVLPGQAFVWPPTDEVLRMVKVGKASFRAEQAEGNVATFKASPTRVVQLGDPAAIAALGQELADMTEAAAVADAQPATDVDAFLGSRPAPVKVPSTRGRTRRGKALPAAKTGDPRTDRKDPAAASYAKGDKFKLQQGLQNGCTGTVAWVRASYLLVKCTGNAPAKWYTVVLADGTEHPADSGGHAESIGRQLARKAK